MLLSLVCAIVVCAVLTSAWRSCYSRCAAPPRLAPLITAMGVSLLLQTLAMIIWKPNRSLSAAAAHEPSPRWPGNQRHAMPDLAHGGDPGDADVAGEPHQARARDARHRREPRVAALMGVRPDM